MLKEQRCNIILSEINRKNLVSINELMALTSCSRSTIRRDIEELEEMHLLCRVRGGVTSPTSTSPSASSRLEHEPPFLARLNMHYPEKQRIALAAHRLVQPNDILFLGAGTSVYEFAKTLSDISPLYVATNDLKNAVALAEYENVDLTVLGGTLRQPHYSLNGYFTEQMISQMNADKAFIGVDSINFDLGYMNFSAMELQTNKLLLQSAKERIVLCDHSKFEVVAFVNICKFQEIDLLITGKELEQHYADQLKELEVNFITV